MPARAGIWGIPGQLLSLDGVFNSKHIPVVSPAHPGNVGFPGSCCGVLALGVFGGSVEDDSSDLGQIRLCTKGSLELPGDANWIFTDVLVVGAGAGVGAAQGFRFPGNIWQGILPTSGGGCCVRGLGRG